MKAEFVKYCPHNAVSAKGLYFLQISSIEFKAVGEHRYSSRLEITIFPVRNYGAFGSLHDFMKESHCSEG